MAEITPAGDVVGEQYALLLFEETIGRKGRTATIADAESDIAFPKNNVFVDISGVGVLARRGLNVMNYLACNAPLEQLEFDCDVDLFKFLINYASRNHQQLVKSLRETQKTSVVVMRERPDGQGGNPEFVSIPLVGLVGVANGRVYFKFDPAIRKLHKDPRGYTFLSLRTTSSFKSSFAHALYEKLKSIAYRGSPTEWLTLQEARAWLDAKDSKYMDEFKEFRRVALGVAVQQINELSDLYVEYETKNVPGSKKISHIRFVFREQEGAMVVQSMHQTEARKTIYDTLRGEFGIGAVDFQAITANSEKYTPERLQAAIDFVRHRMANHGRGKKVQFPGRLFMKALQEGWTVPTAELTSDVVVKPSPAATPTKAPRAATKTKRASSEDGPQTEALRREFEIAGEEGFRQYLKCDARQRGEFWASFTRTTHFRVLRAQLQLDKDQVPYEQLVTSERLRQSFGKHVLDAQKKAAKKPSASAQAELGLG